MELVILMAVVIIVLAYFLWRDRKYEESGGHPLDGVTKLEEAPYKVEPPALTTKADGIGHESVEVPAKKAKTPTKPKNTGAAQTKAKKAPAKTTKPSKAPAKSKKAPKK